MAKQLIIKEKFDIFRLKYGLAAKKERKMLGIDSVEEHQRLIERDMEVVSGKTYSEILNGSIADYNQILSDVEYHDYKLSMLKTGRNYLIYENTYLRPYMNEDGSVNIEKLLKLLEERQNHKIVKNNKRNVKKKLLKKILGDDSKIDNLIERKDLLQYFPDYYKIEQVADTNLILIEYDDLVYESLEVFGVDVMKFNSPTFDVNKQAKTKEALEVRSLIDEYLRRCGKTKLDKFEHYDFSVNEPEQFANYYEANKSIAIGSQHQINEIIDNIKDPKVKEELKKCRFSLVYAKINPIGPNIYTRTQNYDYYEYQKPSERKASLPIKHIEEEHVKTMLEDGFPINEELKIKGRWYKGREFNQ